MQVDRERFLILAAALAACHDARSAASVTLQTPLPVAAAPDPCAGVAADNAHVLAHPTSACKDENDGGDLTDQVDAMSKKLRDTKNALFDYCKTGHGTWIVVLVSSEITAPTGESGRCGASVEYQLVYVSKDGRVRSKPRHWEGFADEDQSSVIAGQVDYDGDGSDELVLEDHAYSNGGGGETNAEVLRATTSAIEPYPVGFDFDGVVDADHDGRPDLVRMRYFHAPEPCMGLFQTYYDGVPLLVHSLPDGKFSMSDDVARRWAKKECPTPSPAESDDDNERYRAASCRRIWGEPVAAITKGLSTIDHCDGNDVDTMRAFLKPDLPFKPLGD
jgi:hypothetical protein